MFSVPDITTVNARIIASRDRKSFRGRGAYENMEFLYLIQDQDFSTRQKYSEHGGLEVV